MPLRHESHSQLWSCFLTSSTCFFPFESNTFLFSALFYILKREPSKALSALNLSSVLSFPAVIPTLTHLQPWLWTFRPASAWVGCPPYSVSLWDLHLPPSQNSFLPLIHAWLFCTYFKVLILLSIVKELLRDNCWSTVRDIFSGPLPQLL